MHPKKLFGHSKSLIKPMFQASELKTEYKVSIGLLARFVNPRLKCELTN